MEFNDLIKGEKNTKTISEVKFLNPLVMAFVGDSIYSLYVKTEVLDLFKTKVDNLTKTTATMVNAKAQEDALFKIMDTLTDEEKDLVRRARNTNIHTKAKNYSIETYRHATALEALIGYLYLTGNLQRLKELLNLIFN